MQPAPERNPATEAVQMIDPLRCLAILSAECLAARNVPMRLICRICPQRSAVSSRNGTRPPLMAALAKQISRLPNSLTAAAIALATCSSTAQSFVVGSEPRGQYHSFGGHASRPTLTSPRAVLADPFYTMLMATSGANVVRLRSRSMSTSAVHSSVAAPLRCSEPSVGSGVQPVWRRGRCVAMVVRP